MSTAIELLALQLEGKKRSLPHRILFGVIVPQPGREAGLLKSQIRIPPSGSAASVILASVKPDNKTLANQEFPPARATAFDILLRVERENLRMPRTCFIRRTHCLALFR
jgi:hypothetical protein